MKINKIIILIFILGFSLSCSDWLDVKPYDEVEGDELYKTTNGVQKALNGLYLGLVKDNSYRFHMTSGMVDILAQNFFSPNFSKVNYKLEIYQYDEEDEVIPLISNVWAAVYKSVSDCNIFMEQLQIFKDYHNEYRFNLYYGEALGLRTYLQFDMFRLFGPIYDEENEELTIPYYSRSSDLPTSRLTSKQIMDSLFVDIDRSINYLKNDPVLSGISKGEDFDQDYRNVRFNLFAAYVLKARMYLHIGDKTNAYNIASSLLNNLIPNSNESVNFKSIFYPITEVDVQRKDPVYFSEMIFCLHDINRESLQRNHFSLDLTDENILVGGSNYLDALYEDRDIRREHWVNASNKSYDISAKGFVKYQLENVDDNDPYRYQIISMIRLGEVYLIAAEAAPSDIEKANWLDELRLNRGFLINNTVGYDLDVLLKNEHQKEFYGEGQYFYFLKRNEYNSIVNQRNTSISGMINRYTLPLPQNEINY